jgi:hypothetical protein
MPKKKTPHLDFSEIEQHLLNPDRFFQRPQLTADAVLETFGTNPTTIALCDLLWCLDVWQLEAVDAQRSDEASQIDELSSPEGSWTAELAGANDVTLPRWALVVIQERLSELALRELKDAKGKGRNARLGTRMRANRTHLVRYLMAREMIETGEKTREQVFNEIADRLAAAEHFAVGDPDAIRKSYDRLRKDLAAKTEDFYIPGSPALRRMLLEEIGAPDPHPNLWPMPETNGGEETP